MPVSKLVLPPIQPDLPARIDYLDFKPYVRTFVDIITDENTQTPLTIGVFGPWGSGKTSLMRMIEKELVVWRRQQERAEDSAQARKLVTAWFNAWRYNRDEALWRALILRVLAVLRAEMRAEPEALKILDRMETNLHRAVGPKSLGELSIEGQAMFHEEGAGARFQMPTVVGLDLLEEIAQATAEVADKEKPSVAFQAFRGAMDRLRTDFDRKRVQALEDFLDDFETLVEEYVYPGALIVFVDDLDRCLPERAVEILEAIKLFFNVSQCIFVLGIDRQVVERGIRLKYHDYERLDEEGPPPISGTKYLEKIVQIPFQLPIIDRVAMKGYVRKMAPDLAKIDDRCYEVFTVGMEPNPRRVKRTLNIFLLLWRLSRNRPDLVEKIEPVRLLKIVIIQMHHPNLFALLPRDPGLLIELEKRFRAMERQKGRDYAERASSQEETTGAAGPEAAFLGDSGLRDLLTLHGENETESNFCDLQPGEVKQYVHLSSSAVEAWAVREGKPLMAEMQWVRIPAGEFLMGMPPEMVDQVVSLYEEEGLGADRKWLQAQTPQHSMPLPAFDIARYLVTNAEYAAFVEDSEGAVSPPRHWEGGAVPPELARHPVVNVTWQDACAYCEWLSQRTDRPHRLPTEVEWEKAASWDFHAGEKRAYPWGDQWDPDRCNNGASTQQRVTPVGQFSGAGGDSPYGVSDMAGNVWEWTLSKWGRDRSRASFGYPYDSTDGREAMEGSDLRVLRGGSFYDGPGWCRSTSRFPNEPLLAADYIGFRVVRLVEGADGTS